MRAGANFVPVVLWSCCVGELDVQALELSYCISVAESLLVRGLGHQCQSSLVTELCFADDAVITASTREDIIKATVELQQITAECGLTISFPKTKLMVAGRGIIESDVAPLCIGSSVADTVPSFKYLGSVVESHGRVMLDLDDKIASHRVSRAFGALQKPVFRDGSLSLVTKKLKVDYQAVVLDVLLYVAETWPAKQRDIRRLEGFHHRCLRSILGIGRLQ